MTAETGPKSGQIDYPNLPETASMGCLFSNGRERLLALSTDNNVDGAGAVVAAAVGAPYAAIVNRQYDEHYGGDNRTVSVFDLRNGAKAGFGGESSNCYDFESAPTCTGLDKVVVGHDGVSAAHLDGGPLSHTYSDVIGVSCASASLCLTYNQLGAVSSSTHPASGLWSSTPLTSPTLAASLSAISCPSTSLCVGISQTAIYTSTDPTGGSDAWTKTQTPFGTLSPSGPTALANVMCPSTSLCVVTTWNGNVLVSTDPTGGASAWSIEDVDGSRPLLGISCPTTSECVATDDKGNIVSTTNPSGGAGAWTVRQVASHWLDKIACPTTSLCVAIEMPTQLLVSTDPLNGPWTTTLTTDESLRSVSCPSTSLCVAGQDQHTIFTSTSPASGSWSRQDIGGTGSVSSVSCPTTTFCAAASPGDGHVLISTNPAGGAITWTPVLADRIDCPAAPNACGTEQIIASDRTGVHTLDHSTEFEVQTGPQLTGLALNGDTLTWQGHGSPASAQLQP